MTRDVVTIIPLTDDQETHKDSFPDTVTAAPFVSGMFEVMAYFPQTSGGVGPVALLVDSDDVMFPMVTERLRLVRDPVAIGYVSPTGQLIDPATLVPAP